MESLDVGSRYIIQAPKETPAKGSQPQLTKGWAVTEKMPGSFQILLIETYPTVARLESVPDLRQQPNLTLPLDKINN